MKPDHIRDGALARFRTVHPFYNGVYCIVVRDLGDRVEVFSSLEGRKLRLVCSHSVLEVIVP